MENFEEYLQPAEYDAEYGSFEPDGPFYEALAREFGGPVLDLGCGTGRITIPLARAGFTCVGLDLSTAMLERARAKGAGLPIRWVHGDASSFHLEERFGLILMAAHGWQHLLDRAAQESMLACAREHLVPGRALAFVSRNPNLAHLFGDLEEEPWHSFTDPQGRRVQVSGFQRYNHVRQIQTWTTRRRYPDGIERTTRLDLRYTFPQEMELLLHHSGFELLRCYGDWDLSPLIAASPEMIYVCRDPLGAASASYQAEVPR